jgi:hypothetical protein
VALHHQLDSRDSDGFAPKNEFGHAHAMKCRRGPAAVLSLPNHGFGQNLEKLEKM